jgi:trk system potassium uptake protein TrkA
MNIVIMGCGRVGARLARQFDHEGHQVAVIDLSSQALERLDTDFNGSTIVGTGIDEDVLKRAGIEQAEVFLALTSSDNPNIMASQIARLVFRVPRVITRIYDPAREDTFHDLGLETICPTTLVATRIHEAVQLNTAAPLDDGEIEALPGETLARTHTTTMPVTPSGSAPRRTPDASGDDPDGANDPSRKEPSWRQRLFRQ